ncbi:MAG: hypothetical protein FWB74_01860 [Defluviitaleaceae bacterium]|nr:hypothetical protein [Defluviitaleaceae bacterium]
MLFTEYLESVKGTEDEARLIEKIGELKEHFVEAREVPVAGKMIEGLIALEELGSIEAFLETHHIDNFEGWDVKIDFDKGQFSIYPGAQMRKKFFIIAGCVIAAIVLLVILIRKLRRK